MAESIAHIKSLLSHASRTEYEKLKTVYAYDKRKGVHAALASCERRLLKEEQEMMRIKALYDFDSSMVSSPSLNILGLDEVGRGPIAGPLAIGGVVLNRDVLIEGLNDSKKIPESKRDDIAVRIKESALSFHVTYVDPEYIDSFGISAALKKGFLDTISTIEQSIPLDCILLDGIPLRLDAREVAIIKGDAQSASIAAASIVAKTARDALMRTYAKQYPAYAFDQNKGYGSAAHIDAIRKVGLCPIHRKTFCTSFGS